MHACRSTLEDPTIFEGRGGKVGEYPVLNFQYRIITNIDDLYGRLAVQNRCFETEGIDAVEPEIESARERGDRELAALYDAQLADEICHVRFANEHVSRVASADPASVMRVGRALNYASAAFLEVMGQEAIDSVHYGVNAQGRREAGFSADEVRLATELKSAARARQKTERG